MISRNALGRSRLLLVATLVLLCSSIGSAADNAAAPSSAKPVAPKTDARYPFRTDFANENLTWYQLKPGEFPPHHSDHRVSGELVSVDHIHRTGQFRTSHTGELRDFSMLPYGSVRYLNTEADLRDVPLGTDMLFFLFQDAQGEFTQLAAMLDQFTLDAAHSFSYRLAEIKLEQGKLLTTRHSIPKKLPDLGKKDLVVTDATRVWKGDKQIKLTELAVGDELLGNITGKMASNPGRCTDLWVGVDTHQQASAAQRKKFAEFVKWRGLPGWVDKVEGNNLTITLFSGDWPHFKPTYMGDFAVGQEARVVVANDELRTWNPPVDKEKSNVLEIQKGPAMGYGSSGVRMVVSVANMLEGFRKGRVVRIFGPNWTIKDQFYGESLMGYGFARLKTAELIELTPKEYPEQFPFRTDYGNDQLPWYQVRTDELPPPFSEHLVFGELVKVDGDNRGGQFLADRTGKLVNFSLIPQGTVQYLNVNSSLSELPVGTRYRFHLYQDAQGEFTRASFVSDEFSFLASNFLTYRIDALLLDQGKLHVARQIPEVKNYNGDMERVPDLGRAELLVSDETRVWKGDQQVKLSDLKVGDVLLVNLTGERPSHPSRAADLWVGEESQKLASDQQTKKQTAKKK